MKSPEHSAWHRVSAHQVGATIKMAEPPLPSQRWGGSWVKMHPPTLNVCPVLT